MSESNTPGGGRVLAQHALEHRVQPVGVVELHIESSRASLPDEAAPG
jgi:hypothetical protein